MISKILRIMVGFSLVLTSAASAADKDQTVIMEYYYQIKWGHQEEFIELYKRITCHC